LAHGDAIQYASHMCSSTFPATWAMCKTHV
jgi:hypothetical protein